MVNDIILVIETCYLFVYWVVSATLQQVDNVIYVDGLAFGYWRGLMGFWQYWELSNRLEVFEDYHEGKRIFLDFLMNSFIVR